MTRASNFLGLKAYILNDFFNFTISCVNVKSYAYSINLQSTESSAHTFPARIEYVSHI
jgi:hypothetical protein